MSHLLASIKVVNFKSVIDEAFELSDYTPLIGYNNAGKSNILSAIRWLLRKSSLGEDCFNDSTKPVSVEGKIAGVSSDLLAAMQPSHAKAIEPFIENGVLHIKRIQVKPGENARTINVWVKDPAAVSPEQEWRVNPTGLDVALGVLFPEPIYIGAMENSEDDVSKAKAGSTIGKLLAEILDPIEAKYGGDVISTMQVMKNLLDADGGNRAAELVTFDEAVNRKVDTFFPNVNVRIHVPTPELKEIFGKGTIKIYEDGSPISRDVSSLGHGAQRSIQMALIQHLAEIKRESHSHASTTLLLIDEPELYLHPQAVEVVHDALKRLATSGYQIVFSTHSALMLNHGDVANAVLIRKSSSRGTHRRVTIKSAIPLVESDAGSQLRLLFSLSNSSSILFSEKVILTEGKTELRLMPRFFEKVKGRSLGLHKCALVQQGGVDNTRKSMLVLSMMDLPTKAIVDLDYALKNTIRDKFLDEGHQSIEACKAHLKSIADRHGIRIGGDGWPEKNGAVTAAKAFAILANEEEIREHLNAVHAELLTKNIWFWKRGAIEDHLGVNTKNEDTWSTLAERLKNEELIAVVPDSQSIVDCINWLVS
jgi:predicted ATP-dependent endonuclease of OLD family